MSFPEYLRAQQSNLEQLKRLPYYTQLLLPVDALYRLATHLVPPTTRVAFARLLLLSHRSFLSAGSLALRALPDDAEAITRRALEAARLALAIKHDPVNLRRWQAYEKRMARWKSRRENKQQQERLRLGIKYPTDRVSETLGKMIGMLSDSSVHFTPEFLTRHTWKQIDGQGKDALSTVRLNYFIDDPQAVARGLWHLAADHLICLEAFDTCFDQAFSRAFRWKNLCDQAKAAGDALDPGRRIKRRER